MKNKNYITYFQTFNNTEFDDISWLESGEHTVAVNDDLSHHLNSRSADPGIISALGCPEHVVNCFDGIHQFLGMCCRNFYFAGAA